MEIWALSHITGKGVGTLVIYQVCPARVVRWSVSYYKAWVFLTRHRMRLARHCRTGGARLTFRKKGQASRALIWKSGHLNHFTPLFRVGMSNLLAHQSQERPLSQYQKVGHPRQEWELNVSVEGMENFHVFSSLFPFLLLLLFDLVLFSQDRISLCSFGAFPGTLLL